MEYGKNDGDCNTLEDYSKEQWWYEELKNFLGNGSHIVTDDTRRAALVALNYFNLSKSDDDCVMEVFWQRAHPIKGWISVDKDDIFHYQEKGQSIRPLYTRTIRNQKLMTALNSFLSQFGMDEDEWNRWVFNQAREALE